MAAPGNLIGLPKVALETPALLVDLDVMEANIARIAETCRRQGVGWRPHTKAHKTRASSSRPAPSASPAPSSAKPRSWRMRASPRF